MTEPVKEWASEIRDSKQICTKRDIMHLLAHYVTAGGRTAMVAKVDRYLSKC
jgi:hypothetical protein